MLNVSGLKDEVLTSLQRELLKRFQYICVLSFTQSTLGRFLQDSSTNGLDGCRPSGFAKG